MHGNSLACIVQSFVEAFSALYLTFWINIFVLNLHLTIVWRNDWLSERYTLLGTAAFLYAGVPAIVLTALGKLSIKTEQPSVEDDAAKLARRLRNHRERMLSLIFKSWRSLALCVAIVVMFGSFWSINLEISILFQSVTKETPWLVEWYTCALQGNSRADCAKVAAPFVPSIVTMAMSYINSCIGFVTFLIFGTGVFGEWKQLLAEKMVKN
ncbi:hypothetical protein HDU98_006434 [Podochytrium sp. JEL0797]|nr:hypothetical protein HDU98_006434 [Podochytrium sp. JEL0797]